MRNVLRRLQNRKSEEGFSILELALVVVLIGILVAIAIPVYNNQVEEAKISSLRSDVSGTAANIATWQQANSLEKGMLAVIPDYNLYVSSGGNCSITSTNPNFVQYHTSILRKSDPEFTINLCVFSPNDDNNRYFCVEGLYAQLPDRTVSYHVAQREFKDGTCADTRSVTTYTEEQVS